MSSRKRKPPPTRPAQQRLSAVDAIASAAMSLAVLGSLIAVDTRAEDSFDAPKQLLALAGIVICAIAALGWGTRSRRPRWTIAQRAGAASAGGAVILAALSAAASAHRSIAIDSVRAVLLFALAVVAGALLDDRRFWRAVVVCLLVGSVLNAIISILQAFAGLQLFSYASVGGRSNVSALMGNDGLLALSTALAAIVALHLAVSASRGRARWLYASLVVIFFAVILINRNVTAVAAFLGASAFVAGRKAGWKKATVAVVVSVLAVGVAIAVVPQARVRVRELVTAGSAGAWNQVLSYRLGAWSASVDMIRDHPLLGYGPGTFGAEFVPHLLAAELRHGARFTNPFLAGSYAEAHSDYLQLAAESGLPAAFLALVAALATIGGALLAKPADQREQVTLAIAVVLVGAIAALTWFPFQRPATALPVLLALGALWRFAGAAEASE